MIGYSNEFDAAITTTDFDPTDHVERTAWLLERLAAEVRRFGVIDGNLERGCEYAPGGDDPTGVHKISLTMRIDHAHTRDE